MQEKQCRCVRGSGLAVEDPHPVDLDDPVPDMRDGHYRHVETDLSERTSRKVALTPVGRQLCEELRPAYEQVRRSVRNAELAGRGIQGTVRAGYFGSAGGRYLLEVAESFEARHPECAVRITELQLSDGANRLRSGEVDAMLCCFPMREPDMTIGPPLISEVKMLAVPSGHALAHSPALSLEDLADAVMIQNPRNCPPTSTNSTTPERPPPVAPSNPARPPPPSRRSSP